MADVFETMLGGALDSLDRGDRKRVTETRRMDDVLDRLRLTLGERDRHDRNGHADSGGEVRRPDAARDDHGTGLDPAPARHHSADGATGLHDL